MSGGCTNLSQLSLMLFSMSEVPVIDTTGLSRRLTYDVRYGGDGFQTFSGEFADALEDQLGLKLRDDRGPVPVLVIDSVQQPNEN